MLRGRSLCSFARIPRQTSNFRTFSIPAANVALRKTFCPTGAVADRNSHYYVPRPAIAQKVAAQLDAQTWPLVYGPRASGKSSLQFDIVHEARKDKYIVLPFDWYDLRVDSVKHYWTDLSEAIIASLMYHYLDQASTNSDIPAEKQSIVLDACHNLLKCDLSTKASFLQLFSDSGSPFTLLRNDLALRTILSGDGFSRLYDVYKVESGKPAEKQKKHVITIMEETLDALRYLKNHRNSLHAMIGFGTFAVYDSVSGKASPFDVKDRIAIPPLTFEEVHELFAQVEKDYETTIAPGIVEDIFALTAGHAGLVGVFGNVLINNRINDDFVGLREDNEIWKAFLSSSIMMDHITSFPGILELIKAMIEQAPSADTFHTVAG